MDTYLERAQQAISAATRDISRAELTRPRPGKWSAAEVLEHLVRAYSSTARLLERHLQAGQPSTARPSWAQRWRTLTVIEFGYLPSGRPAPEFTRPRGLPPEQVLAGFHEQLHRMDAMIARCEQQFGGRATIAAHAIFGPLTGRQWRRFHWVHTRHHAQQIAAARASR